MEQPPIMAAELVLDSERMRAMPALHAAPALTLTDVSIVSCVPLSTINTMRAEGRGPRCFKIGRRLFVTQQDYRAWIDFLSQAEADDAPSWPPRKQISEQSEPRRNQETAAPSSPRRRGRARKSPL